MTPSSKYDFKFKDYAPWVFRSLREHFHIDASDYLVQLWQNGAILIASPTNPLGPMDWRALLQMTLTHRYVLSELGSPGKSGSFFYFSSDYRFIIKTIAATEHRFFRSVLQQYYNVRARASTHKCAPLNLTINKMGKRRGFIALAIKYVIREPNTLLVRFYGLHRVKLPHGRKIHFVVMENVFPPNRDMHETYDLKVRLKVHADNVITNASR